MKVSLEPSSLAPDIQDRRAHLLKIIADGSGLDPATMLGPEQDIYGVQALANLLLNRWTEQCNEHLRFVAAWFDHPHPQGRAHDGECDFVALHFAHALLCPSLASHISVATRHAMMEFFRKNDFESRYLSENHGVIFRASRYLASRLVWNEYFQAYQRAGRELAAEDARWLLDFISYRAKQGWGEFDSPVYLDVDLATLILLRDCCGKQPLPVDASRELVALDAQLGQWSQMMLDVLLADMAVESINGFYGGAHGRIYPEQALDHSAEHTHIYQHLYLGTPLLIERITHGHYVVALTSDYQPASQVLELVDARQTPYEVRERKHLHNLFDLKPCDEIPGSVKKYSYVTEQYIIGCVQAHDPYPAQCPGGKKHHPDDPNPPGWYAHHQEHAWDLSFASGPRCRVFTHHPGTHGEHNHWTGDRACGCGHFMQHRSCVLGIYDIPADQPCQYIHAYVPREEFDEIIEHDHAIFLRRGCGMAALWFSASYQWTTQGPWANREIIVAGGTHGMVCQAEVTGDKYANLAAFVQQFLRVQPRFDRETRALTHTSIMDGEMFLNTQGQRLLNRQPLDLEYPTYGSPGLQSAWNSGIIEIGLVAPRLRYDFCCSGLPS